MQWLTAITARLPARVLVPLVLIVPALLVSLALMSVAIVRGRSMTRTLVLDGFANTHQQISANLTWMLDTPQRMNNLNAALLDEGRLGLDDLRRWSRLLLDEAKLFPHLSCMSWDGSDGRQAWIARYPGSPQWWFGVRDDRTGPQVLEYGYDASGSLRDEDPRAYPIDPRDFAPYQTGARAGGATWCEPFEWVNEDGSAMTFALAHVRPHHAPDGALLGVITAQLTLADISQFLSTIPLSRRGVAFVMDREGLLVADSRRSPVVDGKKRRRSALHVSHRAVAAAAAELLGGARAAAGPGAASSGSMVIDGEPFLITTSRFDHATGLRWWIATVAPETDFTAQVIRARRESLVVSAAIVVATLLLGLLLAKALTRPLLRLVEHVARIGDGDLETRLTLSPGPELRRLSHAINAMAVDLRDGLRLRHALSVAEAVQKSLLPQRLPSLRGLDLAAHSRYCEQTGGDYYDFLDVPDARPTALTLVIGDVVGHGIGAAVLMATARGILRSHCAAASSLAAMLDHANRQLVPVTEHDGGRFMTMLVVALDVSTGCLRWASAGHDMPLLYDAHADDFTELAGGLGLPLGVLAETDFTEATSRVLRPGQVLFVGTDGVWETRNPQGDFFGKPRVRDLLREAADQPATEIAARLDERLIAFRGRKTPQDDITYVVIKTGDAMTEVSRGEAASG